MKTRPDLPLLIKPSGAAIAVDVSPDPRRGLGSVVFHRLPKYVDTLISGLHFGAFAHQTRSGMDRAIPLLLEQIPTAVAELLRVEGKELKAVNALLVPQYVPEFRQRVADLLGIKPGRVFDPSEERADRYTCSLPYLLHWAQKKGVVGAGDVGLLIEVGSGLQVVCAVYYF